MASSGAGEQYIGSKIWLISKAEIRYEGILHSIDPNESTLALASVRSHGTEDRPAERVVAPREEVFELILFRASDIKDIRLCDTPKPAPPPPERAAPYDPAIIQVQSSAPGSFPAGGLHHPGAMAPHIRPGSFMVPPYAGYGGAFGPGAGLGQNLMPPVPAPTLGQSTITFSGIGTDLGPVGPPPHPDGPSEEESSLLGGPKSEASTPLPPSEPDVGSRKVSESEGRLDDGATAKAAAHGQRRDDHRRPNRGYQDNRNYQQRDYEDRRGGYRGGRGYEHRGGRGGYESRGGRGGYRDQTRDATQASTSAKPVGGSKLKFEQDYDFERANQDFERVMQQLSKTKISDTTTATAVSKESTAENGDVETDAGNGEVKPKSASEQPCYNKTKSFFDTISCEALERSKGGYQRPDWQKERQLNSETFGLKPLIPTVVIVEATTIATTTIEAKTTETTIATITIVMVATIEIIVTVSIGTIAVVMVTVADIAVIAVVMKIVEEEGVMEPEVDTEADVVEEITRSMMTGLRGLTSLRQGVNAEEDLMHPACSRSH